jgi:hypothetical protein
MTPLPFAYDGGRCRGERAMPLGNGIATLLSLSSGPSPMVINGAATSDTAVVAA